MLVTPELLVGFVLLRSRVTGIVLLGRGEMRFSPTPDTERGQLRVFSGNETLVALDFRSQRLVARVAANVNLEPGQPVWVRLPADRVLTFDGAGHLMGASGRRPPNPSTAKT